MSHRHLFQVLWLSKQTRITLCPTTQAVIGCFPLRHLCLSPACSPSRDPKDNYRWACKSDLLLDGRVSCLPSAWGLKISGKFVPSMQMLMVGWEIEDRAGVGPGELCLDSVFWALRPNHGSGKRALGFWVLARDRTSKEILIFLRYEAKEKVWSCLLESRGLACFLC